MDPVAIFRDVDNIPLGVRFDAHLNDALRNCRVVLAVIGPDWLSPRLQDPNDHLRLEIELALGRAIPIIPILVRGATLPKAAELPSSIRDLVLDQGVEVRSDRSFKGSVEFLAKGIHAELRRQELAAAEQARAEREARARAERDAKERAAREAAVAQEAHARAEQERQAELERVRAERERQAELELERRAVLRGARDTRASQRPLLPPADAVLAWAAQPSTEEAAAARQINTPLVAEISGLRPRRTRLALVLVLGGVPALLATALWL